MVTVTPLTVQTEVVEEEYVLDPSLSEVGVVEEAKSNVESP
jgi:hypothetical protein